MGRERECGRGPARRAVAGELERNVAWLTWLGWMKPGVRPVQPIANSPITTSLRDMAWLLLRSCGPPVVTSSLESYLRRCGVSGGHPETEVDLGMKGLVFFIFAHFSGFSVNRERAKTNRPNLRLFC